MTTSSSLRHALLLPGTVFYKDGERYIEMSEQETDVSSEPDEAIPQKIAAKAGGNTLLFDPKDIDYIESLKKAIFLSVRNSNYQVSYTLEELLKKYDFFRCHRSYIVNVQKVEEIEKWTKNSYSLKLNNEQHSQIPLAKGRIAEMRETYNW